VGLKFERKKEKYKRELEEFGNGEQWWRGFGSKDV